MGHCSQLLKYATMSDYEQTPFSEAQTAFTIGGTAIILRGNFIASL